MLSFPLALLSALTLAQALPTPLIPTTVFRELRQSVSATPSATPSGSLKNPKSMTAAAFPQEAPPSFIGLNISAPLEDGASIDFQSCSAPHTAGVVNSVIVSPCSRSSDDEPCHFHVGETYFIQLNYTSYLEAETPRSSVIARDDTVDPSEEYAYSGQTFDGCAYTPCAVPAAESSLYTYEFRTLQSPLSYLTFNLTQSLDGPSLFCAGFPVAFVDDHTDEQAGGEEWSSLGDEPSSTSTEASEATAWSASSSPVETPITTTTTEAAWTEPAAWTEETPATAWRRW
ncbi:hypothetical protein JCM11641_007836 [Rhodosporidiobolus odoratus]